MNSAKYKKDQEAMDKILAYALFMDEGIKSVERMYPQYKSFVLSHKGKSLTEVKNDLLSSRVAS